MKVQTNINFQCPECKCYLKKIYDSKYDVVLTCSNDLCGSYNKKKYEIPDFEFELKEIKDESTS